MRKFSFVFVVLAIVSLIALGITSPPKRKETVGNVNLDYRKTLPTVVTPLPTEKSFFDRNVGDDYKSPVLKTSYYRTPIPVGVEYVVKDGDSLVGIVSSICGSAEEWPRVAEDNGLPDPNVIQSGRVVWINCEDK